MKNNILKGIIWTFSGTGIQVLLQFIVFILLSRLLEPDSFGVMSTALALITLLSVFSKVGIGPALVQKEELTDEHVKTGVALSLYFSVVITILVFSSSNLAATFFNMPELDAVLKVMAFAHLIQGVAIVPEALLQRNLEFKSLAIIQIISYLVYGIIGVSLSILGLEVWALVYAFMLNGIVKTILYIFYKPYSFNLFIKVSEVKELLNYGLGYSIGSINNQIALQGDTFVIGKFLGAATLGVYSRAFQFFSIPVNLIGTVIEKVLFPTFSRMQTDIKKMQKTYNDATALIAIICLPLSLIIFLLAEDIILFLFGEKWHEAVVPFQLLILALLPRVSYKISDSVTKSLGKVYKSANRQLVYGISIVIGVSIGQVFGLVGACIGVLVAVSLNYFYMAQIALALSGMKWSQFFCAHVPGIKLALISVLPIFILARVTALITLNSFLSILILGGTFLIILVITIYLTPTAIFGKYNTLILRLLHRLKIKKA